MGIQGPRPPPYHTRITRFSSRPDWKFLFAVHSDFFATRRNYNTQTGGNCHCIRVGRADGNAFSSRQNNSITVRDRPYVSMGRYRIGIAHAPAPLLAPKPGAEKSPFQMSANRLEINENVNSPYLKNHSSKTIGLINLPEMTSLPTSGRHLSKFVVVKLRNQ